MILNELYLFSQRWIIDTGILSAPNLKFNNMLETDYKFGEVHTLATQIENGTDRVQFKNIFGNDNGGVSLLAFKAGQKLDQHIAPAEVMVTVLEGEIVFTMIDRPLTLTAGQFLLMGADVPHSVEAKADSKVMLTKIKP